MIDPSKSIEEQQRDFAAVLEQAIKNATQGLEIAQAELEKERRAVAEELEAAKLAREKAVEPDEKRAEAYIGERRDQLLEYSRMDLRRKLAHQHLSAGEAIEDVCHWLDVDIEFVQPIADLVARVKHYHQSEAEKTRIQLDNSPRLRYTSEGRGGTVYFENNVTSFDMWWEFAMDPALVIVDIPTETQWKARTKIPVEQRNDILRFIGEQLVADQTGGRGRYAIGDQVLTIYKPGY